MPAPVVLRRFRTRVVAAFVLVAGVTAGLLALGSFLAAKEYRQRAFARHADDAARLGLLSAPGDLSLVGFEALLDEFRARAGFETVALSGEVTYSSSPRIGPIDVPRQLREAVGRGETGQATVTVGGTPYLVVGGTTPGGTTRLFFFFDRSDLLQGVRELRNVLAVGWLGAVVVAAIVGHLVARRTLRPVARAADAAQALADGLLETRLAPTGDDEFGAWAAAFNRMAAALEDKIAALSAAAERERRFTADVAHELRTPLTGMVSAASLVAEDLPELRPDARRAAELLVDDVRRLENLVLELLELARLDAGQEEVRLEVLDVAGAVKAVVREWQGRACVSVAVAPGLSAVADRARFRRVVSNLVANAAEHGGGEVEVVGRDEGDTVAVAVLDRGPGLPPQDMERAFDRFYKADTARSRGGSGLGLAIAREHARAQGGSVEAANRAGGGANFTFRLPAAPPAAPMAAEGGVGAVEVSGRDADHPR